MDNLYSLYNEMKDIQQVIEGLRKDMSESEDYLSSLNTRIQAVKEEIALMNSKSKDSIPKRHHFEWTKEEDLSLKRELWYFLQARAEGHQRTPVAIAARIVKNAWLLENKNFIKEKP